MTDPKVDQKEVAELRELTLEEMEAVTGGGVGDLSFAAVASLVEDGSGY